MFNFWKIYLIIYLYVCLFNTSIMWASTKEETSLGHPGTAITVDFLTCVPETNLLFARALFTFCKRVISLSPTFEFLIFSDTSTNLIFCSKSPTPLTWTLTLLSLSESRKFSQCNKNWHWKFHIIVLQSSVHLKCYSSLCCRKKCNAIFLAVFGFSYYLHPNYILN